jgi:hypothetical protein
MVHDFETGFITHHLMPYRLPLSKLAGATSGGTLLSIKSPQGFLAYVSKPENGHKIF